MDALTHLRDSIVARYNATTARHRIIVASLAAFVVVVLACAGSLGREEPRVELLQGIATPPNRLSAIEMAFAKAGLDDYVIDQNRIKVRQSEKSLYGKVLVDAQLLPPDIDAIGADALSAGGLFESAAQKAERIKNARQRQLALIISEMNGIDNAWVFYDEGKARGFQRKSVLTASVSVSASANEKLSGEQVRTIRHLVAAAIAGLEPQQISVTDLKAARIFPAGEEAASQLTGRSYSELKGLYERQWTEKIRANLSRVPGIVVSVDVALRSDAAAANLPHSPQPQWTPKAVRVTLSVPSTYVDKVWRGRQNVADGRPHPTRTAEDLLALQAQVAADLRSHVANLIPREHDGADSRLDVQLTFFDDLDAAGDKIVVAQYKEESPWSTSAWQFVFIGLAATVGMIALRRFQASGRAAADLLGHSDTPAQSSAMSGDQMPSDPVASDDAPQLPAQATASLSHPTTTPGAASASAPSVTFPGQRFSSRLIPNPQSDGIELNDLTTSRLAHSAATATADAEPGRRSATRPFHFVDEASHDDLADLLLHENAQIIAIVFSHLEAEDAGAVLQRLPSTLQVDVMRRLSDLDDLSDEVVREIERSLEARLMAQLHKKEKRNAGVRAVGNILGSVNEDSRQTILGVLKRRHGELARQLQPSPAADVTTSEETVTPDPARNGPPRDATMKRLTFGEVTQLDGDALCLVLSATDTRHALLAMSGAGGHVIDRLTEAMKPAEADRLRAALTQLGPAAPGAVLASQRVVAEKASQLNASGRFQRTSQQRTPVAV